ncbi:hypothetical protein JHK82_022389 [Glycine max]|nr:hypothetical protein JHK82_022389 [Glycine max]
MDQKLVSSWFHLHSSVPLSYVKPPESRPGMVVASDKKKSWWWILGYMIVTLKQILKASEEFGFFQVINNGVSKEFMDDTLNIFKEFHAMPAEEKIRESSRDPNGSCRLYTSREINNKDIVQFWRDTLRHFCPPSGEFMDDSPLLLAHHYPPCPEPSLTLGAPKHRDPDLATVLLQEKDINALQVFKDGEWIVVEPIPYAFVVNISLMLQIISNGRFIGAEHRVVTNSGIARTTVAYFIRPTNEQIIEPAKLWLSSGARPIYSSITFEEFVRNFMSKGPDIEQELLL